MSVTANTMDNKSTAIDRLKEHICKNIELLNFLTVFDSAAIVATVILLILKLTLWEQMGVLVLLSPILIVGCVTVIMWVIEGFLMFIICIKYLWNTWNKLKDDGPDIF